MHSTPHVGWFNYADAWLGREEAAVIRMNSSLHAADEGLRNGTPALRGYAAIQQQDELRSIYLSRFIQANSKCRRCGKRLTDKVLDRTPGLCSKCGRSMKRRRR